MDPDSSTRIISSRPTLPVSSSRRRTLPLYCISQQTSKKVLLAALIAFCITGWHSDDDSILLGKNCISIIAVSAFRSTSVLHHYHPHHQTLFRPEHTNAAFVTSSRRLLEVSSFSQLDLSSSFWSFRQSHTRRFNSPPSEGDSFIDIGPDNDNNNDDNNDNQDENKSNADNNIGSVGNASDNNDDFMEPMTEVVFIVLDPDDGAEPLLEEEEDDEDDEEETEEDPYTKIAASEFQDDKDDNRENRRARDIGALTLLGKDKLDTTMMDWGGALSTLRERVEDVESGKSQDPSHVLFRLMSSQTPNQIIGQFVSNANPMVVQAMSGAIGSLLGGLSNPNMGVETIVKASGEKISSLCFQLQMTGYMFRNAEYVLALKDVMDLRGKGLTLDDYRDAFDRVDSDGNGYIEISEIQKLFQEVYGKGNVPPYEVSAFLKFFDQNQDGKISWEEFEKGFGAAIATAKSGKRDFATNLLEGQGYGSSDEDDEDDAIDVNTNVSGTIEIELKDGKVVEVDAKEYIKTLKEEAQKLKDALRREKLGANQKQDINSPAGLIPNNANGAGMDIAGYIASRQGDVKSLTEGISPEIVDTMKKLVEFVLEGGDSGKAKKRLSEQEKVEMEMEIPGSALQQLALWQLVLGYRLREEEVKGDYVKLLKG
ncbi:DUF760 domain containing protein [Nitzschia inconspicua]|uniref:DUF760 domain containing protein n=1 Tax=Nitzschia inconspicua TaxID=303405 RepID=A0A9K3LDZ8_9STRA|nr:DUF760 domain containing protein [Nitzschia inconspicua]